MGRKKLYNEFEKKIRRAEQSKNCKRKNAAVKAGLELEDYIKMLDKPKMSEDEIRLKRNEQSRICKQKAKLKKEVNNE